MGTVTDPKVLMYQIYTLIVGASSLMQFRLVHRDRTCRVESLDVHSLAAVPNPVAEVPNPVAETKVWLLYHILLQKLRY